MLKYLKGRGRCGGAEVQHIPHMEALVVDVAVAGSIPGLTTFNLFPVH